MAAVVFWDAERLCSIVLSRAPSGSAAPRTITSHRCSSGCRWSVRSASHHGSLSRCPRSTVTHQRCARPLEHACARRADLAASGGAPPRSVSHGTAPDRPVDHRDHAVASAHWAAGQRPRFSQPVACHCLCGCDARAVDAAAASSPAESCSRYRWSHGLAFDGGVPPRTRSDATSRAAIWGGDRRLKHCSASHHESPRCQSQRSWLSTGRLPITTPNRAPRQNYFWHRRRAMRRFLRVMQLMFLSMSSYLAAGPMAKCQ